MFHIPNNLWRSASRARRSPLQREDHGQQRNLDGEQVHWPHPQSISQLSCSGAYHASRSPFSERVSTSPPSSRYSTTSTTAPARVFAHDPGAAKSAVGGRSTMGRLPSVSSVTPRR